jgi:hypothetical protein
MIKKVIGTLPFEIKSGHALIGFNWWFGLTGIEVEVTLDDGLPEPREDMVVEDNYMDEFDLAQFHPNQKELEENKMSEVILSDNEKQRIATTRATLAALSDDEILILNHYLFGSYTNGLDGMYYCDIGMEAASGNKRAIQAMDLRRKILEA